MWTEAARKQHGPRKGRYPSDMTDAEWGGGPRTTTATREVMNAVRHVLRTGCQRVTLEIVKRADKEGGFKTAAAAG
jgi:hypothetical protein